MTTRRQNRASPLHPSQFFYPIFYKRQKTWARILLRRAQSQDTEFVLQLDHYLIVVAQFIGRSWKLDRQDASHKSSLKIQMNNYILGHAFRS